MVLFGTNAFVSLETLCKKCSRLMLSIQNSAYITPVLKYILNNIKIMIEGKILFSIEYTLC